MNRTLRLGSLLASWHQIVAFMGLMVATLLPALVQAQVNPGTLSPATSTVCTGFNSGLLTLSGNTNPVIKFQADYGSGFVDIAGSASQTYTFANLTQTTSYRAVTQNGTATAYSNSATVTVNQPPTATINSQGPTTFCQRGTIYLVAGPGGTGYLYQFLLNGRDISGATSQTYSTTVTTSGNYSVRVSDAAGCSAISAVVQIRVSANNVVNLSAGGPTTFCQGRSVVLSASVSGAGVSGYTFQYGLNGNQIPGATSATYTATTSGSYTVAAYNPTTCSSTSTAIVVTVNPVPPVTLSYPAASYCQSGPTNPAATASPAGGSFISSTGISLNASTGTLNLAQSQPGTYLIYYTSVGICPATATANITITAAPTADFSYAAGSRCAGSIGSLTPTATAGATAGSYTAAPTGLSLDTGTGTIDLAQSQPGTYTLTNTVAPANGCAAISATTQVVLTAQPVALLTAGGPTTFCQGSNVALTASGGVSGAAYQFLNNGVAIAGATANSYSATASGSYTVLITNPGGCASTSAATTIVVNAATTATFSYPATSFCVSSTQATMPTVTGTAGGTFSAATGLALDATSGAITPNASTAGTYTVTYAIAGPCPSTATFTIVIAAPGVANFSYSATTYCMGGTSPGVVLASGATAGTYTATPTGLSIDAATGTIDLSQSQLGTYVVTNTVAASGGCAAVAANTTVSISSVPMASLIASGPTSICQGSSVTLTANGGVASSTYQFLTSGQPINGATGASFIASASGSYSVVITNGGTCAATSAVTTVVVNSPAAPTLSYSAASFCQNAGTAAPTVSVTGGSFAASGTGLTLDSNSGLITLAQSQPGTYTVTFTGGSPCPGSTTATVTVTATPSAAFAYAGGATFCSTASNPTPTITGATGGTFSAPTGLVIDPATGTLNLQTSTAGTYAVTYAVAGTCPANTTVGVTITAAPVASFAYAAAGGYCAGSTGMATPGFTGGGSAGTFTASGTSLVLNASTGQVNLSQSQPGTYTIVNTVAASGGCAATTATATIVINAAPMATLAANGPTTFCAGGTVGLTATAGTGLTYQFLNNGVAIAGATAATYPAAAAGSYTVAVTNASGCTSTSAATTVVVNATTTATFSYPATSFCASSTQVTTPTVTGTAGGTFSAATGLGLNATTGAITPNASTAGTYAVTYAVAGPCPSTATFTLTITTPAAAAFSYANPAYCATGTATVALPTGSTAGTFASATGLSLNAGTGAINLSASTAGTYTVTNTVAASGSCAATTATTTITVNAFPMATLAANGPTTFCTGGTVGLTATAGTGLTYQFLNNGVAIAGATAATYPAAAAGSYTVAVTNASGCTSTSAATTVVVNATTTATFSYPATSFCASSTQVTTPTVTGTAGGTFSAATGLGLNATTGAITPNASTAGTYAVTYAVAGPCPSTATFTLTITTPAAAAFSYANPAYCATGTATVALPTGSTAGTFASATGLSLNAGTGAINLSASTAGTYTVTNTVAASGGCAATTATTTITVNPLPATPMLSASGAVLTTGAVAGATYQFYRSGTAIAGATGSTYTATQNGTYTVVLTSAMGCTSQPSVPVTIQLTATQSTQATFALTVYPNPTLDGHLTVMLGNGPQATLLAVYNALGQQVLHTTLPANTTTGELDLSRLATGVYMLRATTSTGTAMRRVVRQ